MIANRQKKDKIGNKNAFSWQISINIKPNSMSSDCPMSQDCGLGKNPLSFLSIKKGFIQQLFGKPH